MSKYTGFTPAQARANANYDAKTYKKVLFALRIDDDEDILTAIDEAKQYGDNHRAWLRKLFEGKAAGYTKEQIVKAFDGFRGTLTPEIIERMLGEVKK